MTVVSRRVLPGAGDANPRETPPVYEAAVKIPSKEYPNNRRISGLMSTSGCTDNLEEMEYGLFVTLYRRFGFAPKCDGCRDVLTHGLGG